MDRLDVDAILADRNISIEVRAFIGWLNLRELSDALNIAKLIYSIQQQRQSDLHVLAGIEDKLRQTLGIQRGIQN